MIRRALWPVLVLLMALLLPRYGTAEMGDVVFTRKPGAGDDYPPATFSHFLHRMQFKCHVCHDSIFKMKADANQVTMDAIQAGKYCGACHNDNTAFGVTFEACERCHRQ